MYCAGLKHCPHLLQQFIYIREAPRKKSPDSNGHCPNGGGGVSTLARMVCGLGHLFREELPMFKWAFAWLWGGQNACQDGLGHLCSEN